MLERGRYTTFDVPGQEAAEFQHINNRGQIVGVYENTATPGPRRAGVPPMGRMA